MLGMGLLTKKITFKITDWGKCSKKSESIQNLAFSISKKITDLAGDLSIPFRA